MKTPRCSTCNEPLLFVYSLKRHPSQRTRRMPLNPEPTDDGNIRIVHGHGEVLTGLFLGQARTEGEELYLSHFATCVDADKHRSRT